MKSHDFGIVVSCLCPTRGKLEHLRRAIKCFEGQKNCRGRELILVHEKPSSVLEMIHEIYGDKQTESTGGIAFLECAPGATAGAKRNIALAAATGEFVAVWDDDDWHGGHRLEMQLAEIERHGADACMLSQERIYDEELRTAYISVKRPWEHSLVCRREILGPALQWADISPNDDEALARALLERHKVALLDHCPELYTYVFHGKNLWGRRHHESLRLETSNRSESERIGRTLGVLPKL